MLASIPNVGSQQNGFTINLGASMGRGRADGEETWYTTCRTPQRENSTFERAGFFGGRTSEQFVTFLDEIAASQAEHRGVHVICDNVSRHKTALVQPFPDEHPTVQIHYTPMALPLSRWERGKGSLPCSGIRVEQSTGGHRLAEGDGLWGVLVGLP